MRFRGATDLFQGFRNSQQTFPLPLSAECRNGMALQFTILSFWWINTDKSQANIERLICMQSRLLMNTTVSLRATLWRALQSATCVLASVSVTICDFRRCTES